MIATKPTGVDRARLEAALGRSVVPTWLHEEILEYAVNRRLVGSFLRAVLENNLKMACAYADVDSGVRLVHIVAVVNDYLPWNAWQSATRVEKWLAGLPLEPGE